MKTRVRITASPIHPGKPTFALLIQEEGKDDVLEFQSGNFGKIRIVVGGSNTSWEWRPLKE